MGNLLYEMRLHGIMVSCSKSSLALLLVDQKIYFSSLKAVDQKKTFNVNIWSLLSIIRLDITQKSV